MRLAELCDTSASYIGEIEIGRKFPSTEMIEKFAETLRVEPYHLFKNNTEPGDSVMGSAYPLLPKSMKTEIREKIDLLINEVLERY